LSVPSGNHFVRLVALCIGVSGHSGRGRSTSATQHSNPQLSMRNVGQVSLQGSSRVTGRGCLSPPEAGDRTASDRGCYRPLKVCPNARQRQGTTRRSVRSSVPPPAGWEECSRTPTISAEFDSTRRQSRPRQEVPRRRIPGRWRWRGALSDPTRFRLPGGRNAAAPRRTAR
jgi:hypothetical protein